MEEIRAGCTDEEFQNNFHQYVKKNNFSFQWLYKNHLRESFLGDVDGCNFKIWRKINPLIIDFHNVWFINQLVVPTILEGKIENKYKHLIIKFSFRKSRMAEILFSFFILFSCVLFLICLFGHDSLEAPFIVPLFAGVFFLLWGLYFLYIPKLEKKYLRDLIKKIAETGRNEL